MEAVAKKMYNVNITATGKELDKAIESLTGFYATAAANGQLDKHSELWELKDQLVMAKNNAED
jgi:hypothetical protein